MPRFEVYCPAPPLTAAARLQIDADHWLAALEVALERTGRGKAPPSILCDVRADGAIEVADPRGGSVIWIRELREAPAGAAPGPRRAAPAQPPASPAAPPPAPAVAAPAAAPSGSPDPAAAAAAAAAKAAEAAEAAAKAANAARAAHAAEAAKAAADAALAGLAGLDRKAGLERLLEVALAKVDAESGSVLLLRPGGRELEFVAVRGPVAPKLQALRPSVAIGGGIAGHCVSQNLAIAVSDARKDPRHLWFIPLALGYETRAILCAPIAREGKVLGALEVLNKRGGAAFGADDLTALTALAQQAAEHVARSGG